MKLSTEDLTTMQDAYRAMRNAPVMLIGSVDTSAIAHDAFWSKWAEMGVKYHFNADLYSFNRETGDIVHR